nr:H31 [uncultured bacterium]
MSSYALEKAMWTVGTSSAEAEKFRQSPAAYAEQFNLDADEKVSLATLAVGDMARRGASTLLLLMGFMAVHGPGGMGEYLQRMNKK